MRAGEPMKLLAVIGTAGHIDHGKTALVRRMTGVESDRLKREIGCGPAAHSSGWGSRSQSSENLKSVSGSQSVRFHSNPSNVQRASGGTMPMRTA